MGKHDTTLDDPASALLPENVAQTIIDLMETLGHTEHLVEPEDFDFTKSHLVGMTAKRRVVNLTGDHVTAAQFLKPARRKGTANLKDLDSLIDWADRFKGETSVLFADPNMDAPSLTCIADYHAEGAADPLTATGDPSARHCHHRGTYKFPLSNEWKAWMKISGVGLDKDEMGEFIEEHAQDVLDPTPAILKLDTTKAKENWETRLIETAQKIEGRFGQLHQLLQMSKSFQVYETSDLKVETNRDTGEAEIKFTNEHKDANGQKLVIPNLIIIAIPVFLNGAPYRMAVRFRYRKRGSDVKFILSVYNVEKVFEAAFEEAIHKAAEETGLPLFQGTPES